MTETSVAGGVMGTARSRWVSFPDALLSSGPWEQLVLSLKARVELQKLHFKSRSALLCAVGTPSACPKEEVSMCLPRAGGGEGKATVGIGPGRGAGGVDAHENWALHGDRLSSRGTILFN